MTSFLYYKGAPRQNTFSLWGTLTIKHAKLETPKGHACLLSWVMKLGLIPVGGPSWGPHQVVFCPGVGLLYGLS